MYTKIIIKASTQDSVLLHMKQYIDEHSSPMDDIHFQQMFYNAEMNKWTVIGTHTKKKA